ncbi:acetyltransferase EpsM [Fluviicoccus keumensis]|uniref:Acetyltransferase EpsM n=1 Tax=Fluviicoccus keumensis TaxID=1435465 RepID=A0A4Q7Z9N8_9GAMM|nr:acetyltransferase [Fluviicoccus keumensis]RZU47267.1 acetyltransferase EpsM [Fluviicoccus keumensis]
MPTEPLRPLYLIGASGHARVIADAALRCWPERALVLVDDNPALAGQDLLPGLTVYGTPDLIPEGADCHVSIGNNQVRLAMRQRLAAKRVHWVTVIHPDAVVSPFAAVGEGSLIAARAVVAPGARLGWGVIVNHGAVVDHDCRVADGCHIAPAATLAGAVTVGEGALVGAGANVLPGLSVGADVVIGAGAVVTRPVPDGQVAKGCPARWI